MRILKDYETYPLSSLQEGMLFHTLSEVESGVDIEQIICTLREKLDLQAFECAWNDVVKRHEILRSGFEWERVNEPLQFVEDSVEASLEYTRLEGLPELRQAAQIDKFLHEDRLQGFDMRKPPLMRFNLFELDVAQYKFVWTFHHILLDGRSFPLVLEEVFGLYDAITENRELELEKPRPYRKFIEWLRKRNLEEDEKYWRQYLSGFKAPTSVTVGSYAGSTRQMVGQGASEVRLGSELTSKLEEFALKNGLTLGTLIQGGWALLLRHYSGEEDIVFGTTRSGRHAPVEGIESMIGLFINTLPVRIQFSSHESILSYLKRMRAQTMKIWGYEHSPLHRVQQWSDVQSGSPLFEILIVFENYLLDSYLRRKGGRFSHREFLYRGRTNYPLTLLCYRDKEMLLRIEYDQNRFDQESIWRMIGQMEVTLGRMVAGPDNCIAEVLILTESERNQILVTWNNTKVDYTKEVCLHDLFERQAEKTPDRIAVEFGATSLTYREFNDRTNQLAHYLQKLGVGPETLVGVYMERSLEMVVSLYGILKAGGAYVPLDPEYPADRVAYMIEDTRVPVVLTQRHLVDRLPEHDAKVICLDSEWDKIAGEKTENLASGVKPENVAYVIYTSGSTGKPKGVMNEHRGIVNRLLWMQDEYGLTESDRVLQKTPYSFDVSVWEFFWPLLVGSRLVVAPPGSHRDPAELINVIIENKITTLHFVPSMLQMFLREEGVEKCTGLKRVICSGEALPYELQERFFQRLNCELHNLYGPTEAAVDVTFWKCERGSNRLSVPIGRPVANTQIYILDQYLQPVPIGVAGELHIGGVQVARGYLNRPDLTSEKFIPDPFSKEPGARLYKTGDLARYLPDGAIEYLGRNDFQIKVRGLRIELGEIEAVMAQHPEVSEVVVTAKDDKRRDKRLVGYFVGKSGRKVSSIDLRDFLKSNLPDYMVPQHFVQLDALPLLENGKVNRKALPEPAGDRPDMGSIYVGPRTDSEKVIAKAWRTVLGIEKVGVNDNFFDLGGTSLLLIRVLSHLNDAFHAELRISQLIEYPTVGALAEYVSRRGDKQAPLKEGLDRGGKKREELARVRKQRLIGRK